MSEIISIGLDHGNGKLKARSTRVNRYIVPSAIALKENIGESFMGKELNVQSGRTNDSDSTYVWGYDVKQVEGFALTMGHQQRNDNPTYKTLTQLALGALAAGKSQVEAVVVTGVPSNLMGTKEAKDLQSFLKKTHVVVVEEQEIIIKVLKVVVIPQPVGTIMSLYLDVDGYVKNEKYETEKIAVIDIGNGTTDLDYIKGLKRQNEFRSIPTGMYDVYNRIAQKINKEDPHVNAKAEIVEEFFASGSYVVSNRKIIPFDEEKEKAIKEVGEIITAAISQHWKQWDRFDEIILTGGGARVFDKIIRNLIPDVTVMNDAQFSNADGFYRYAQYIKGVEYDEQSVSTEV